MSINNFPCPNNNGAQESQDEHCFARHVRVQTSPTHIGGKRVAAWREVVYAEVTKLQSGMQDSKR